MRSQVSVEKSCAETGSPKKKPRMHHGVGGEMWEGEYLLHLNGTLLRTEMFPHLLSFMGKRMLLVFHLSWQQGQIQEKLRVIRKKKVCLF